MLNKQSIIVIAFALGALLVATSCQKKVNAKDISASTSNQDVVGTVETTEITELTELGDKPEYNSAQVKADFDYYTEIGPNVIFDSTPSPFRDYVRNPNMVEGMAAYLCIDERKEVVVDSSVFITREAAYEYYQQCLASEQFADAGRPVEKLNEEYGKYYEVTLDDDYSKILYYPETQYVFYARICDMPD